MKWRERIIRKKSPRTVVGLSILLGALGAGMLLGGTGCQTFMDMTGKGHKDALYEFPEKSRILVMVDTHANGQVPAEIPAALGQSISDELFQMQTKKCQFVGQARLEALRRDNEKFHQMTVSDVAKATDADFVLYVDLTQFTVQGSSDNQIVQAQAQARVLVDNRQGGRLFPTDGSSGTPIPVTLPPTVGDTGDVNKSKDDLIDLLTIRISRMFLKYDLEDPILSK